MLKQFFIYAFLMSFSISFAQFTNINTNINHLIPDLDGGSVEFGDYDNDGDLDILLTGRNTVTDNAEFTKIYRNDGNNVFTDIELTLGGGYYAKSTWGDYDNDGDLDILLVRRPEIHIYRNDGNDTFTLALQYPLSSCDNPDWGDYNNDGFLDFYVSWVNDGSLASKIFKNTGNDNFSNGHSLPGTRNKGKSYWYDTDNDRDLDILLGGYSYSSTWDTSRIMQNNGNGFTDTNVNLGGGNVFRSAMGDYNNDGNLDILISYGSPSNIDSCTKIYKNNGNNIFTDINAGLLGVKAGTAAWGDFDSDGNLDVLVSGNIGSAYDTTGYYTRIYHNDGNDTFSIMVSFPGLSDGAVSCGDFDNDGDLDFILTGGCYTRNGYWNDGRPRYDFLPYTYIYRNDYNNNNTSPSAPTNLYTSDDGNFVNFSWDSANDDHTPSSGLNYVIRIGTTPGGSNIVSSMSSSTGHRLIAKRGYANGNCSWKIDKTRFQSQSLYYWSVQAIDGTYKGSQFAADATVAILPLAPVATSATRNLANGFVANWNESSNGDSYRLDVSTDISFTSFVPGYQDIIVYGLSQPVPGLAMGTIYYYRVRSVNSIGIGSYSNTMSVVTRFTDNTGISTLSSGFEGSTSFPTGWSQNSTSILNSISNAHFGSNYILENAIADWFSTPLLNGASYLTFWAKASSNAANFTIKIQTSADNIEWSDLATYSANGTNTGSITSVYSLKSLQLNIDGSQYIRWYLSAKSGNHNLLIDDIEITSGSLTPVAVNATNISPNSFTANWDVSLNADSYLLDVSADSVFSTCLSGYVNIPVNNLSMNITGLESCKNYYYRVRGVHPVAVSMNSNTIGLTTTIDYPIITIQREAGGLFLRWNYTEGASYRIEAADYPNGEFTNATDYGTFSYPTGFVQFGITTFDDSKFYRVICITSQSPN